MNLYELTYSYQKLNDMIEAGEVEADELQDTLDSITDAIEVKAEGYAKVIRTQEANVIALKSEIERLTSRKAAIENNIKYMKENLMNSMVAVGKDKIKTSLFNISVANNPLAVSVTDESLIPAEYFVPQPAKLDKTALKNALKGGATIEGAELTQGKGLRIK